MCMRKPGMQTTEMHTEYYQTGMQTTEMHTEYYQTGMHGVH